MPLVFHRPPTRRWSHTRNIEQAGATLREHLDEALQKCGLYEGTSTKSIRVFSTLDDDCEPVAARASRSWSLQLGSREGGAVESVERTRQI